MNIFQKSITPDMPRVLEGEQIYVYVPQATSTNAGIASYKNADFKVDDGKVSLRWPIQSITQGPLANPSLIKVRDTEFEYTNANIDLQYEGNIITSTISEIQIKRDLRDAYSKPDLVMLDPNYFPRTIVEKDGKQYYKYNTTAIHYIIQNLTDAQKKQARNNIDASSNSDISRLDDRITEILAQNVLSVNGKIGHIVLKNSDLENDTNYSTVDFVNSSIATNTATFRGTYNSFEDLKIYDGPKDYNDYAFVIEKDSAGNTVYNRYKYDGTTWLFEYSLNNSSFTQEQWAAINSGITSSTTINNKLLNTNVILKAQDVGAVSIETGEIIIKNTATALETANTAIAKANEALQQSVSGLGSKIYYNDELISSVVFTSNPQEQINTLNTNKANLSYVDEQINTLNINKADLDYVDRQVADLIGAAPETLNTLEELAIAFEENADVVKTLEDAIVTKANKADIEPTIQFAESERQKSKNLFDINSDSNYKSSNQRRYVINGNTLSTDNDYTLLSPSGFKLDTAPNTDYTVSFNATYQNYCRVYVYGISNDAHTDIKVVGGLSQGFNSFKFNSGNYDFTVIGFSSALGETATFDSIQVEEGNVATSYQPHNGPITHNNDAPVVFAENERNRTINLFNYKTQAGAQCVTNNQDGSFTVSNMIFYYPNVRLNVALKPNTKYTFAETVLEISDSAGLEASGVAFGVVAYYTDGTYAATSEIPIRGTGRYSGTFTTNNKTIDYVEYRILRKANNTSTLNGKVADISICEGDNTTYYPYEGLTVHEEQLKEQMKAYLPLSGGILTGPLRFADNPAIPEADTLDFIVGLEAFGNGGNLKYTNKDKFKKQLLQTNGAIIKGRVYGNGDDEGLIIPFTDNNWAGVILGNYQGHRSAFYLNTEQGALWKYVDSNNQGYEIKHPCKSGTIALQEYSVQSTRLPTDNALNLIIGTIAWANTSAGLTASISGDQLTVEATSGNGNWLSWDIPNQIEAHMNEGDTFTFAMDIRGSTATSNSGRPQIYFKGGMGYYNMDGDLPTASSSFSTLYYKGVWSKTESLSFHFGFGNCTGKFYLKNFRFQKGIGVLPGDIRMSNASCNTLSVSSINLLV